jgi:L-iditol 2-dehydrogenase
MVRRGQKDGGSYALGHELVGRIIAAGNGVKAPIGQRVVAAPYVPCGACPFCLRGQPTACERLFEQGLDPGGLAKRVRIPRPIAERGIFPVPETLTSDVAALTEPIACCVQAVETCGVAAGDTVLIIGDGPMGLMNAAVARAYGASLIIIAGLTPSRLELAASHYADVVAHVQQENLSQKVRSLTDGRGADVVLVAVPSADAALSGLSALRRGGALNAFAGTPEGTTMPLDLHRLHYDEWRLTGSFGAAPQHMRQALHLLSRGQVRVAPLITGRFPFDETPAAIEHMARQVGMKAVVVFE